MSTVFPITLEVKDSNGNVVGTTQITQDVADKLYSYYVGKLEQDKAFVEALSKAVAEDDQAISAIYEKIKEKLANDLLVVRFCGTCPGQGAATPRAAGPVTQAVAPAVAQALNFMLQILPLQVLASMTNVRPTTESLIEQLLPVLIIVPLLNRLV